MADYVAAVCTALAGESRRCGLTELTYGLDVAAATAQEASLALGRDLLDGSTCGTCAADDVRH